MSHQSGFAMLSGAAGVGDRQTLLACLQLIGIGIAVVVAGVLALHQTGIGAVVAEMQVVALEFLE